MQVYGKTYGANKYESTLICLALVKVAHGAVELYQVEEGGLTVLPAISIKAIGAAGPVSIFKSNKEIETEDFQQNDSLRSIRFTYNLLEKFGKKKCSLCDCEIPQIVQAAHIWPVASIKQALGLSLDQKLDHALNGHNGLWLCENHHKLLDSGALVITGKGGIKYHRSIVGTDLLFLKKITTSASIGDAYVHPNFTDYVNKRNAGVDGSFYLNLS